MARFTQKAKENLYTAFDYEIVSEVPNDEEDMRQYAINKLGLLENIEEEYGIGLITFFDEIKDTRIEEFIREIIAAVKRRKENEHRTK